MVADRKAADWQAEALAVLASSLDTNEPAARMASIVVALLVDRADLIRWAEHAGSRVGAD